MLGVSTRVDRSGPLFDGRAPRIMDEYVDDLEEQGAEWALRHVQRTFHAKFQNPTGYYESRVHISNVSGEHVVNDGGFAGPVYGPWLEGVGSRNETTRFKGYHAFRNAANRLELRFSELGHRLFNSNYQSRF